MYVVKEICHCVAVKEKGKVIEEGKLFDVFTQPIIVRTTWNVCEWKEFLDRKLFPKIIVHLCFVLFSKNV